MHRAKKRSLQVDPPQPDGKAASDSPVEESVQSPAAVAPVAYDQVSRSAVIAGHANSGDDPADEHIDADNTEAADAHRQLPRCPNCGWRNVRLSHSTGMVDTLFKIFSVLPFRCRSCGLRFHRRWSVKTVGDGE